ncbi:hypothetical protein AVEN_164520-1 [Araneus ventricosus]|uniref:PiggyBac transposable element-derived protein domain-containing protein n=1 Tax=Araneus ventricosus TaxID=182803 RepID=A0A4Y2B2B6_ARAVE|nr:hypothetical protein AVEN_164520-1 [Araneus ventricosus]
MPRKRYLTFEEAVPRHFEDDTDDDEQSDTDIFVVPPETAEASDEEEGNDNILNHDNGDLPFDTAGKIEVPSKKNSDVVSLLVEQTNLYARQKNRPDFMAAEAYIRRFIGIFLLTGYHSLPHEEIYWSLDKDISVPIVRDSISRLQYRNMKQNLYDNS